MINLRALQPELPHVGKFPYSRGKLNCVGSRENLQGKWVVVGEISFFVGQMSYFDIFVAMKDITRYQGSIFK